LNTYLEFPKHHLHTYTEA